MLNDKMIAEKIQADERFMKPDVAMVLLGQERAFLASADVLVQPSRSEGLPRALLEGLVASPGTLI